MYSNTNQFFYLAKERIKKSFSVLFALRSTAVYLGSAACLQAGAWAFAWYIRYRLGDELLILHNNPYFGIDWIASAGQIFIIPAWSTAFLLIGFILSLVMVKRGPERFFTNFLMGATVLVSAFSLLGLFFIYLINFH